ncbi:MAG: UDP-N-acetylmuramate:L-alanyl-gamma-D-glutamyl-meso-diaminopimelate ligase [Gammaproteobacteria bacterium]
MRIHILGICGAFMGGVALLAREAGFEVSGSDANAYPPMSTQLRDAGIVVREGYRPDHLQPVPDSVVIGNALSRGNPSIEYLLAQDLCYTSGPQWLAEHVLADRWVVAVAGTHGKTSTASMVAWILEYAGMNPGFLIGGVPNNFGASARLGSGRHFVVEADEYDTAFFDKRAKFVHYRPRTLVLNNLEYDHADIFPDLAAIQRQFHHLIRIVPGNGLILHNAADANLQNTLTMGCWTATENFALQGTEINAAWQARCTSPGGQSFVVCRGNDELGTVQWGQSGSHNVSNGLAAIAAAYHAGVAVPQAVEALAQFQGVKRRMELRAEVNGVYIYDDFAHHPTAIATTLAGLRKQVPNGRIFAVLEPRSNSMRLGVHRDTLASSLRTADHVWIFRPVDLPWDPGVVATELGAQARVTDSVDEIISDVVSEARSGDHIVIMSNGGFEDIHERLIQKLHDT